jgi:hypothetical protein
MRVALHSAVVVLLCGAIATADDLQVDIDFPGGSGNVLKIDQSARLVRINPTSHQERGWDCWWYIKLTGIAPGETIALDVGQGVWATPDRAAFSANNTVWSQTRPGRRKDGRIVYQQKVESRECWFAWGPPFVSADAKRLVEAVDRRCEFATAFELCKTRAGRSAPALVVRQGRSGEREAEWHLDSSSTACLGVGLKLGLPRSGRLGHRRRSAGRSRCGSRR